MNRFNLSIKGIFVKIILAIIALYTLLAVISIAVTFAIFVNLGKFKATIEQKVYLHTGYKLAIGSIDSKLSPNLLPELIITNANLYNPKNTTQNFSIKYFAVTLSYASLIELQPIFANITLNGTTLHLTIASNNSLLINGIKITLHKGQKSSFDFEKWLLKQKTINLQHINFSFSDQAHHVPELDFKDINCKLIANPFAHHRLQVDFYHGLNLLNVNLAWTGDKLSNYAKLASITLKVSSTTINNNSLVDNLENYLPDLNFIKQLNAKTAIDAKMEYGRLQYFYANFNVTNLHYILPDNLKKLDLPEFSGSIKINLSSKDHYTLQIHDLSIATQKGYIINHQNIDGNYTSNKSGNCKINNIDLSKFNSLLSIIPKTQNLKINGIITIIDFSWVGNIFTPNDFNLKAAFNNLQLISKDKDIPSINNLSGKLSLTAKSGSLSLNLNNSRLDYPKMFNIPYLFKQFNPTINWQHNSNNSITFTIPTTPIVMQDFTGTIAGSYQLIKANAGYLKLHATISKVLMHKIESYLPLVIGDSTHKWLNSALIGGYARNAVLNFDGNLDSFPYLKNEGTFYIDTTIDNGLLKFADGWPTINNINGLFQIRNQKIIVTAKSAFTMQNHLTQAVITIPDMTADNIILTAVGQASGSTYNFMQYLINSPLDNILGKFPEKVTALGNGKLDLNLNIPLNNPQKVKVNGNYTFINNTLKLDFALPPFYNVNGSLGFYESGIHIRQINLLGFNSKATLSAITNQNGDMHFKAILPSLDYTNLLKFYLAPLAPLFHGQAATDVQFTVTPHGLKNIEATSNLHGVAVLFAKPLNKPESAISSLNFDLTPTRESGLDIAVNYANHLISKINLNEHGNLVNAKIAIGTKELPSTTSNHPKIIIKVNLPDFYALEWFNSLSKMNTHKNSDKPSINTNQQQVSDSPTIFPLEVLINSQNLWLKSTNYSHLYSDILVNNQAVMFSLNNPTTNGYGHYNIKNKILEIKLHSFNIQKDNKKPTKSPPQTLLPHTTSWIEFSAINSKRASIKPQKLVEAELNSIDNHLLELVPRDESHSINSSLPKTHLTIENLYYENHLLGKANINLIPNSDQDLIIKNSTIIDKNAEITVNGVSFCATCHSNQAVVNLKIHNNIKNLGDFLENLNFGKIVAGGSGTIDSAIEWNGGLADFDLRKIAATINIDLKSGKFLKIDTGSILGKLIGFINLQTITNLISLDFGETFSSGFYFDHLKIKAVVINNKIIIKSLYMTSTVTAVRSAGVINFNNNTVNLYVNVIPSLGTGIAIGAAVLLTPVVGAATYAAEWLLDDPFNKLFAISFHITGTLDKPKITQSKFSDQVIKNINNTIGNNN